MIPDEIELAMLDSMGIPHSEADRILVVPAGCCRRECLRLMMAGVARQDAITLLQIQTQLNVNLVNAFFNLRHQITDANEAFKKLADHLPAKTPTIDLRDKVDRRGRRESQTHFFDKLPRRKR